MGACGSKSASKNFKGEGHSLNAPRQTQPVSSASGNAAPLRQSQGYRLNGEKVVDQEKQGTAAAAAPNSPQLPGSPVPIESGDASAGAYAANANDPEERAKRLAAIEQRKQKDRYANKQVKSRVFGGSEKA